MSVRDILQAAAGVGGGETPYSLYVWGENRWGQRGTNNAVINMQPARFDNLTTWSTVAGGAEQALAVKTNGTLWAWRQGALGSLGLNNAISQSSPVQVGALTNWSKVFCGGYNSFSIKTDNTLWAWGNNQNGSLGVNNVTTSSSPVQIGGLTWSTVSAVGFYTMAIRANGSLWGWGNNIQGQIGDNSIIFRSSPVQIGALTGWTRVAAGNQSFTLAIRSGQLWSWGVNSRGQLGINAPTSDQRSSPVQVGALTDWAEISAGNAHCLAVKTGGTLWAWGENDQGQVGDGTTINRSSPVQIGSASDWSKVYAGIGNSPSNSYAIKTNGTIWAWGSPGGNGTLGNSLTLDTSSPVQIGSATNWSMLTPLGGNSGFVFAINSSGELYGWGNCGIINENTFLGSLNSPVQVGTLEWSQIASGNDVSLGIKAEGSLWSWGRGNRGQLGNNRVTDQYVSPNQIGTAKDWAQIFAFSESGCFAIKSSGTLWAWGGNLGGELGLNDVGISRSSPVQVGALTNWKYIAGGAAHALAVKTDGTLWSWGGGSLGRLGGNNVIARSSPVQVGALTNWAQASGGGAFSVAVKTDGTLWSWGFNQTFVGNLGLNDSGIDRSSPVQIGALTNWKQVSAGNDFCVAVKTDGTLWSWGQNQSGQLGDGTGANKSSPVQIGALTDWSVVIAGADQAVGVRTNGTLWAWGNNTYGQIGDGTNTNKSSPVQIGALTTWDKLSSSNVSSRMTGAFIP
jgi:alpha-tubulin suppressor-like RCC1 family protein